MKNIKLAVTAMREKPLNMDLSIALNIETYNMNWVDSPAPGVQRKPLEREYAEHGHTTSIVRYAPGSAFPAHVHDGGEEFLVLEGIFSDEMGDYPAGTYVRNPPQSRHQPFTRDGCMIFVKLCQFQPGDQQRVLIDTQQRAWKTGVNKDITTLELHRFNSELVRLEQWQAGAELSAYQRSVGEEYLIVQGSLLVDDRQYLQGAWLRRPAGSTFTLQSPNGCLLYSKRGHFL